MGLFRARLLRGSARGGRLPALLLPMALLSVPAVAPGQAPAAVPAPSPSPGPEGNPPAAPSPVTVRFTEPAPPYVLLGDTRLTVEATTTPEARIERVELYAAGRLLSILEKPPWSLTWNAGRSTGTLTLRAVAIDSLGRRGEALLETRPIAIGQREEVRLVNVYASVRDRRGRAVEGLTKDDFTLNEDGVTQAISHFTPARGPLTVALLIDASNSMNLGGKIEMARRAALDFIDSVQRDDRLMVLPFSDDLLNPQEPLTDRARLKQRVEAIVARGGTALYDALYRTADRMAGLEGQRAIVLLSDGRDQALTENEPGSLHLFEEALEKVNRAEVAVYAVGLGNHLETEMDLAGERSLREILEVLARQTGGRFYQPERPGQLAAVYKEIAADLKSQYALGYASTNRARDGRWRSIMLKLSDPALLVRARSGYYAPGTTAPR